MVFGQRWDGSVDEVAPAFRTAELRDADDRGAAWRFLRSARDVDEPPPAFGEALVSDPQTRVRLAYREAAPVGVCAARRVADAWRIGGLTVTPSVRRHGIGRMLLCDLMAHAAEDQMGVIIKVAAAQEQTVQWTRELGYYTYRTWANYFRPPSTN
jgi:ribosomal protein S18 acetylase RimI-like enzyme